MSDTALNGHAEHRDEDILDPERPIFDAHHHLWDMPGDRYLLDDYLADTRTGHNVVRSTYVEWLSHYSADGRIAMRPVGETRFAAACAEAAVDIGGTRACDAIVAHADLALGAAVAPVLAAHIAAGGGRVRGIRHVAAWDASAEVMGRPATAPPGLYRDPTFREGAANLVAAGLAFDAWLFQTQHDDLIDLATRLPDLPIVLNHCGGVLGIGPYRDRREPLFASWREGMRALASLPNVWLKLGGLGMHRAGLSFAERGERPRPFELAAAWSPWLEAAIEDFGAARCMFESNFPPDRAACGYAALWNAFKQVTAALPEADKTDLFHDTAARFYQIEKISPLPPTPT